MICGWLNPWMQNQGYRGPAHCKVILGFLTVQRVSVPNPQVVLGSAVFKTMKNWHNESYWKTRIQTASITMIS